MMTDTKKKELLEDLVGLMAEIGLTRCQELSAAEQEIKELKCEYEKEIKRLKAALRGLYDTQNGAPLIREQKAWEAAMAAAELLLNDKKAGE
jgi:hypothetical protein